ncbi:hypothetical protein ABT218_29070 [Streptomyces sp. NPDC001455]|uniref:hypothetical protein n=1 Tax=Streptomyces sp. NPDC001455 TaxID=3154518 RepID=UPI00331C9114
MTTSATQGPFMLPTERLTPRRHLDMVDVIADEGGADRRSVAAQDVAARLGISVKTVARAAGFLTHTGILHTGRGAWALTELGFELARLRSTDSARARLLLRDHWQGSWFHQRALKQLASGPMEDAKLAKSLAAGLPGPPERGLYLTEWMTYALLLDRDAQGRFTVPAAQHASTGPGQARATGVLGVLDPLLNAPTEQISALPDADFIALMGAYRTVFASLTPKVPRQSEH